MLGPVFSFVLVKRLGFVNINLDNRAIIKWRAPTKITRKAAVRFYNRAAAIFYSHSQRREHTYFFGICLGMQCAVIEFARNVCGMPDANSSEFKADVPAVIDLMPDQVDIEDKGGTMRLGLYPCKVYPDTLTEKAYAQPLIYERHRHRYEFNNEYRDVLTKNGLVLSGISPDNRLVEIVELPQSEHPWFLGCQFHPEFKSRPTKAHPLFRDFIAAALEFGK